jgi:hypothetical protein
MKALVGWPRCSLMHLFFIRMFMTYHAQLWQEFLLTLLINYFGRTVKLGLPAEDPEKSCLCAVYLEIFEFPVETQYSSAE